MVYIEDAQQTLGERSVGKIPSSSTEVPFHASLRGVKTTHCFPVPILVQKSIRPLTHVYKSKLSAASNSFSRAR